MKLSFHGADRTVTGSCHLVECAGKRVLIDCGLFQGSRELDEDNAEPFAFDAAAIDVVLLTHAHLDHCGRLPLLAKRGFRGEIITTSASRELTRLVLLDSAHLQEEDANRERRHRAERGNAKPVEPLYTILDAMNCLDYFGRTATYGQPIDVLPGIRATFLDAGHILGSASILLELTEGEVHRRVSFSGDIGNAGRPLLNPPTPSPPADVAVMETTYGDRNHKSYAASVEEFYQAIEDTFRRGGNVVVPTFALERAQELLYTLHEGMVETSRLPKAIQVYLDSPMAISATEIFRRHGECLSDAVAALFRGGRDPLSVPGVHFTRETAESMRINTIRGGALIMAGSGMATGGRVRHHIRHNIWRVDSSFVVVGFAAVGTLARIIVDGAKTVRLFGEQIPVHAKVYTIGGFSAHAGQTELLAWQRPSNAKRTFLVHGEEAVMRKFAPLLTGTEAILPSLHESFDL